MSPGIARGEPWGHPSAGPAPVAVAGGDAAFAAEVARRPRGERIAWRPDPTADLARAVGATGGRGDGTVDLPCDAVEVTPIARSRGSGDLVALTPRLVVNMAVIGCPPDRLRWSTPSRGVRVVVDGRVIHDGVATGVVVANGQFLRGADLVPRGHPGDGRLEVQVYAVRRRDRRALRRRLPTGSHVPHPGIRTATGRAVEVTLGDGPGVETVELDGAVPIAAAGLRAEVVAAAYVLVV